MRSTLAERTRRGNSLATALSRRRPRAVRVRRRGAVRRIRGRLWRRLVRPMSVLVEERAGGVLGVALAVAGDPDAEQQVEQPDGEPGADDRGGALRAVGARVDRPQEDA